MYSLLHKYKSITVGIITLATGGFFLWLFLSGGVADITAPSKKCVAEVGSGCVTIKDYRNELLRFSNLLQNPQMEQFIKEQVLSNLIAQELLYQKAKSLSMIASDEEVIEVIKSDPTFQEGGFFSATKYRDLLSRNGLTPEEYEEYVRKSISLRKLIMLISNGVYLTDAELQANLTADHTLLSGSLFLITPSDVKDKYRPTEEELLQYYQRNKESFKRQEERVIHVWKEKDKDRALAIYREIKAGKEPQGFSEFRLPDDESKLHDSVKLEVSKLNLQERVNTFKVGDEYVVVFLKQVIPAGYEEFEKVRAIIADKIAEEKSESMLLDRAKEVAQNLKDGKKPDVRSLSFSDTPVGQLSAIVNAEQKDLVDIVVSSERVFGPYPLRQGYGVLLINGRKRKQVDEQEMKEAFRDTLSLKSQAMVSRYVEHLRKNTKIKINRELIGGS